jgi:Protein of unknown function (DUF1549)/Planctomycete cytochrome C
MAPPKVRLRNLSTPSGILRGSESGPVVVSHELESSLLWRQIESDEMPPDQPLRPEQKQLIKRWIIAGAPGLPQRTPARANDHVGDDHWSFRPVSKVAVPPLSEPGIKSALATGNEIDHFLQAARDRQGIVPNASADTATLVRRVCLDLTGMPPTVDELKRLRANRTTITTRRWLNTI